MTVRTPDSSLESLERRYESLMRVVPYLVLAVPLIPYVLSQSPTAGAAGITAGLAALRPDVVLMDLRMPELDGVSAIRALAQRGVDARVLVLTTFDTDTDVLPAIEAGATGYLLKDSPPEELRRGVRAAARGEAVLSPSVATRLVGQVREPAREPLSQRELDILGLISHGCSNREAAARLFISEATVKTHVLHIYAKLGVNDRAAAVAAGFERGLLPRPLNP